MTKRGITLESIGKFKIGYFDLNEYDAFYGRLVFPVYDQFGHLLTMQGRAMYDYKEADRPKYYHGKIDKKNVLYGLYQNLSMLVNSKTAVLVEGPLDVCALSQAGVGAVACLGTSFSEQQAYMLRCYTNTLYIWLDADSAGQKATENAVEILKPYNFNLYFVSNPSTKDASECYEILGRDGVLGELRNAYENR